MEEVYKDVYEVICSPSTHDGSLVCKVSAIGDKELTEQGGFDWVEVVGKVMSTHFRNNAFNFTFPWVGGICKINRYDEKTKTLGCWSENLERKD